MIPASVIFLLLLAIYGVLIAWYRHAWNAIPRFSGKAVPAVSGAAGTKISVLIPARNEAERIGACLESLSRQTYPRELFEVLVIDDHSTDNTSGIVEQFKRKLTGGPAIRCIRLAEQLKDQEPVRAYKKLAIATGIGFAGGELIVATDADCRSHSGWLASIAAFRASTGARFIAAPVRIEGGRNFLSLFQTLDFITLQGITGAAVYRQFHSMCNGANLAYDRSAFYEVDGFTGIDNIPSGDDMLLMHKIFLKYPGKVFFLKDPEAIVSTDAETSWSGFFNQRIRWASKADQYDDKRIFFVLLFVYVLNVFFLGLAVAACWNSWYGWLLLMGLLVKTMVEYPFVRSVAGFFGQADRMIYFPFLQPVHILYTVVVGWLGKFGSYRWKGRKIKK